MTVCKPNRNCSTWRGRTFGTSNAGQTSDHAPHLPGWLHVGEQPVVDPLRHEPPPATGGRLVKHPAPEAIVSQARTLKAPRPAISCRAEPGGRGDWTSLTRLRGVPSRGAAPGHTEVYAAGSHRRFGRAQRRRHRL